MRKRDIISSLFWLIVGIGVCYGGYDLDLGTLQEPGSGFVFFWMGIIMIGLSIGILAGALKKPLSPVNSVPCGRISSGKRSSWSSRFFSFTVWPLSPWGSY